ncbi:peptidyl-prolyl cis-trans isomerase FKBP43 isoform X7 [Medicago truncatula]|uniref:peptidyl-prolyl cis-trans isomerase FKBP43 isoform X7 n=1 Tax=Medicago truncatula TaxID=3880 RepID=UPI000D2F35CF|nr:peptidyl-prolyl cis-trans isomerase FKBP43 isoform X7 [Medicago truncatula]
MAFWGVEIKPGKPFTHTYDSSKGRLHISMATLGHGTAITKSVLQCNVGNRSPVYLCSLYPGNTESLQLNLELEEDGNVILSVLGPRSIHLCGYYLARGRYGNTMDESESYGEDIANTETEKSDRSDEDDYDDSFINDDGDLAVFSASPISHEEDAEEASSDSGRKSAKGSRRRLRKKYQLVESDDDGGLGKKIFNDFQEIDDEDSLPISSLCKKNKSFVRVLDQEMEDCFDKEAIDAGKKDSEDHENSIIETKLKTDNAFTESQIHREAEPSDQLAVPSTVPDVGDNKKSKKKKKGKEKETSTELDNAAQDEPKMNTAQDLLDQEMHDNIDKETVDAGKKDGEDHENSATETNLATDNAVADSQTYREAGPSDHLVDPCTVPDVGDIKKSKKKKKGKEKETKSSSNGDSTELDNAEQDEPKMNMAQDLLDQEIVDNVDKEAVDDGKKDGEDRENITIETKLKTDNVVADIQTHSREAEPSDQLAVPSTVPDVGDMKKSKKKKKGKEKETKSSSNEHSTDLDNAAQDEPKMNMDEDLLTGNEQNQQQPDDKKAETTDKTLPSSQVGQGQDEKPKRKRKERSKEKTLFAADDACISNVVNLPQGNEHSNQDTVNGRDVKISDSVALPSSETDSQKKTKRRKKEQINKASHTEGDNGNGEGIIQDYKADKETAESDGLTDKFSEKKEQHPKLTIENSVDNGAQDNPDGNQSEDKKVKKKKKKSKSQGSEVVNSDVPVSAEQSSEMMKEDGNNVEDTKPSQVRTLSNGLVIQELETGKENGKIAAIGKKISINYTGKLKENGVVVESNAGEAPFKFRLGKGEVIEGWDIGLEGMRVGEKRRLVVPPSMTSKKDGESENIPPNSWLVYDFELVKVH